MEVGLSAMFISPLLKVTVCYSLGLRYTHLQYLMNAFPAQQVNANDLLTCLTSCESDVTILHLSILPLQYRFLNYNQ